MRKLALVFSTLFIAFNAFSLVQIDPSQVEPFMDGVIESKLHDKNIAGATLCIVKDGEVVINKGYGYSDYAKRISVDPDSTLF
ncbi:MAG: hypothetical protein CVT98_11035, partial [Bacteroidetes bacterium HGW-Bacteroidetes-15]